MLFLKMFIFLWPKVELTSGTKNEFKKTCFDKFEIKLLRPSLKILSTGSIIKKNIQINHFHQQNYFALKSKKCFSKFQNWMSWHYYATFLWMTKKFSNVSLSQNHSVEKIIRSCIFHEAKELAKSKNSKKNIFELWFIFARFFIV